MSAVITAVYRDGVFHPTSPPDLAEGATVRLTLVRVPSPPDPQDVYRRLRAVADLPIEGPGGPTDVAANHDRHLYGKGGAR